MRNVFKIGFGGGCHWCTEAVFLSLNGVEKVEQGFIAPLSDKNSFSEAVIVHYDSHLIEMKDLVAIHLDTHRSTQNHSMRNKYRSGVYYFETEDQGVLEHILHEIQQDINEPIITLVLPFGAFKSSEERFHNYYYSDKEKPFCKTHISPKIKLLQKKYSKHIVMKKCNQTT